MAIAYYGTSISPHMDVTPEGFLICRDVPIARTGTQDYLAGEMRLDGDPERVITVDRRPEDVFEAATLASFEGKPVTDGHPPENVSPENIGAYAKGHVQNVRRAGDFIIGDLYITDAALASDIRNDVKREVSCGYLCNYVPDGTGYKQTNIRGNHVAVVPRGRAGHEVSIQDSAPEAEKPAITAEKGRNKMNQFTHKLLTLLGMAAKDASPEELKDMVDATATALDAAPAEPMKDAAPEAAPAAEPAKDVEVMRDPKGSDPVSKEDEMLSLLREIKGRLDERGSHGERPIHDESDLDKMVAKLAGEKKDPEAAVTVPAEKMEDAACMSPEAKDAAVNLLRKVRPAVAGIKDKAERARVVDALLSTVQGPNAVGAIMQAAQDSARANAEASQRTNFEKICKESEDAYAARNPHTKKEA